jgi:tetratricopeptide (TPR) repeat protein
MLELEVALKNKRILVVDDMVEARATLKKMVNIFGSGHIESAMSGDEAMTRLNEQSYDVVLSDYNLGKGKDGQQVLEEARFTGVLNARSLYIIVTGENTLDMVMGALEYEPDGYITKPFTIDMVRQRLTRILTIKNMLIDINTAIDEKNTVGALSACNKTLIKYPKIALKVLRIKGRILTANKQYDEALSLYSSIINKRDVNWALLGKAVCLFYLKKYDESLSLLLETIESHPQYVQCYDWLAKIYKLKDNTEEAQSCLEKAVGISSKAILRQTNLGSLALINKDYEASEKAFKNSIKLGKDSCYKSIDNYLNYGKSLQESIVNDGSKKTKDALNKITRALSEAEEVFSNDKIKITESILMKSHLLAKGGQEENAKKELHRAQKNISLLSNVSVDLNLSLAKTQLSNGLVDEGLSLLASIESQLDPSSESNTIESIQQIKNNINPSVIDSYTTTLNDKAIGLYETGDLKTAMDIFNTAVSFNDAGTSVLLNAIQTMSSYMDNNAPCKDKIKQCEDIFERIGDLPSNDSRYLRHKKLKDSINDMKLGLLRSK